MTVLALPTPVSVVLCTYNPRADYISRTLAALRAQSLPQADWELLVIDNKSDDPLEPRLDLAWHANARVIREDKLGLTPARLRGIREAKGDLLIFVDDDNVLDADFLETALAVGRNKPHLGAWSGQTRGGFEGPPPEWTRRYWGNLAIREFDEEVWSNLPRLGQTMPCGAGLCIRREAAQHYLDLNESGARNFQFDRTGDSLISGGDNDLAACACDIGLGVGLIPTLGLTHLMGPGRLTADYLARLADGIYFSSVILAYQRNDRDELASYRVKPHHWIRAWLNPRPHRDIQLGVLRGRQKALRFLADQAAKTGA
jgi:glycosyltransferase involved in cell wall biosynthesis